MSLVVYLGIVFFISFVLMLCFVKKPSVTSKAYLVRAGTVATKERPPVPSWKKFLKSHEKEQVVGKDKEPLQVHFGYKQRIRVLPSMKNIEYGKAVGDSMSVRGIRDGDYFVFEKSDFQAPSDESEDSLKIKDIVVAKIVDDCGDLGGLKLREIECLVGTAYYQGITYKNGEGTNEEGKQHLRSNIVGKVVGILH